MNFSKKLSHCICMGYFWHNLADFMIGKEYSTFSL